MQVTWIGTKLVKKLPQEIFIENDIHFITAVRSHGDCINKGGQVMSVVLKEAIRQAGCADIKLVAGKNGLTNVVEWVHMVDTTEIADFLSGGEIAFTTGIGVSEKMSLLALVDRVYKNHASAMVVNIGPYVAEIPQGGY